MYLKVAKVKIKRNIENIFEAISFVKYIFRNSESIAQKSTCGALNPKWLSIKIRRLLIDLFAECKMYRYAQICTDMRRYVQIRQKVHFLVRRYVQVFTDMRRYTQVSTDAIKNTIFDAQVCAGTYRCYEKHNF